MAVPLSEAMVCEGTVLETYTFSNTLRMHCTDQCFRDIAKSNFRRIF